MDLKQMIGARIKEIRTKKGITQEQLSERGKENPTLNTLIAISQSLKVDLGEIFSFVQVEDPSKRKSLIMSLLDEADDEQLKLAFKILLAIVHQTVDR